MRMLLALVALLTVQCSADKPPVVVVTDSATEATPASPVGKPGDWILPDDYPPEATRDGVEGVVGFRLTIDPQGRVIACKVLMTSKSPVLDEKTCQLMRDRARLTPARDAKGRAIEGEYISSVRWQIPRGRDGPSSVNVKVTYIVEPDGRITECEVLNGMVEGVSNPKAFRTACDRPSRPPFHGKDGKPVRKRVTEENSFKVEEIAE